MKSLDASLWVDLIGNPFKFLGRGPIYWDCYGLLMEIYRRQNIHISDIDKIVYDLSQESYKAPFNLKKNEWSACSITPGAALLFQVNSIPRHVGVAIDDDSFIHASESMGQVRLDRLTGNRKFNLMLIGAYRYAV